MASFRYYRWQTTKLRGATETLMHAGEFAILNAGTRLTGFAATDPGADTPSWNSNEDYPKAVDNDTGTKWTNHNGTTGYLQLDFGAPVTATGYRWATALGADTGLNSRDPVSWYVDGSSDGTTWTRLDTRTDYATPATRSTWLPDFTFATEPVAETADCIVRVGGVLVPAVTRYRIGGVLVPPAA